MIIKHVRDKEFKKYGKIVEGYDWTELLDTLNKVSDKPMGATIYEPGDAALESLPVAKSLKIVCMAVCPSRLATAMARIPN